jgi:DtxR family Mn-dependent transcriptional regulator
MPAEELQLSASLEDYLEAIYHTVSAKGAARAKDLVLRMGVHNSSVTQALRSLSEKKLINYAPYDVITLTEPGEALALGVVRRHVTLSKFLGNVLGLPEGEADAEACRLEHAVSAGVLHRLVRFVEYFESCPQNDVRWDVASGAFCCNVAGSSGPTCGRDACGGGLDLVSLASPASQAPADDDRIGGVV